MNTSSTHPRTIGLILGAVLLAWGAGTLPAWGQGKTSVQLDSGGDSELRRAAAKSASAVITDINRPAAVEEVKRPDLSDAPVTDRGREAILSRWDQASFYCNRTDLTRSLARRAGGTYEIRDIPLVVEEEEPRSGILLLNEEGTVIGFRYSTEPATGTLTVASEPSGAAVFVDGDSVGTAPLTERLVPGEYNLQIQQEGYQAAERTVTVEETQENEIRATLRRPLVVRPADRQSGPVADVRVWREARQLVVRYDLTGEEDEYEVALQLSTDGGQTYQDLRGTVEGAVGEEVAPGSGKRVTWAALTDYPEGLSGDRYRLRLNAQATDGGNTILWVIGSAIVAGAGGTVALLLGGGGDSGGGNDGGGYPTPPVPPN